MTDEEFENWLDENCPYRKDHGPFNNNQERNAWLRGARAVWAEAQVEIENIKREVEMREHLFKHQADKLAEALMSCSILSNRDPWTTARQALKEYRGENSG